MKAIRILANPISVKELRSRMRGLRAILPMMAYLVILGIFILIQFAEYGATVSYVELKDKGRYLGFIMLYGQLILVLILAPAYASSAITVEKERETFEVMLTTLLTSWEIVAGKVLSGFSYASLLLLSGLPLLSLAIWMGGFEFEHIFWGFILIASCAFVTTCLGILLSTLFGRSYMSTGVTYGIVIGGTGLSFAFVALVNYVLYATSAPSLSDWHTFPGWLIFTLNPMLMMNSLDRGTTTFQNYLVTELQKYFDLVGLPYMIVYVLVCLILSAVMLYLASIFLFRASRKDS